MMRTVISFTVMAIIGFSSVALAAKDDVIPLIQMDNVPLTDAIRKLARQAHLNIVLDPRLSAPPFSNVMVSVRWEGVSAREGFTALLDNYGLVLIETPRLTR